MTKHLLFSGLLALLCLSFGMQSVVAQCDDLFFSEYVEGFLNNKAVEIYNPTDQAVDLSNYHIIRWNNGNTNYTEQASSGPLTGTLEPHDVVVVAIEKLDCMATGQDTCIADGLRERADLFICPLYEICFALSHNGNDALSLNKLSDTGQFPFGAFVDIFGVIGEDPGLSWTDTAPFTQAAGGAFWTRNQTLVRKSNVSIGRTTNGTPYQGAWDPTEEWDTIGANNFDNLGFHIAECSGNVGINEATVIKNAVDIYPNPATNHISINAKQMMEQLHIYDVAGQQVHQTLIQNNKIRLELPDLPRGIYFIEIQYQDQSISFDKIILQ